jgi:hypothetical protein
MHLLVKNVIHLIKTWIILKLDGRCTCEIKSRIATAKAEFNMKRALFISKMGMELRKKLVKCYIWSIPLYVC